MISGLPASFGHDQNGMIWSDMVACTQVADRLNEVIIFRSTGPWSKRWIERDYPTKNFHVKGKSSDWGPHAGLVPYDGTWSKVGFDAGKAAEGTHKNDEGLASGFAGRQILELTRAQIDEQSSRPEGKPPRTALFAVAPVPNSQDLMLTARRSGDGLQVIFLAKHKPATSRFEIYVYPTTPSDRPTRAPVPGLVQNNVFMQMDRNAQGKGQPAPLYVMTSNEVGAGLPMTGDYDLMSVCPTWADYGSLTRAPIVKPGIQLNSGVLNKGLAFREGVGMDNVMDSRLSMTGAKGTDFKERRDRYAANFIAGKTGPISKDTSNLIFGARPPYAEHGDMGNLTPRILRCINELNGAMGATGARSALRRVHHNAESHRYFKFGALTQKDMTTIKKGEAYGDGFPLTVFQPQALANRLPAYGICSTLETLGEFRTYMETLAGAGYYVPKSWAWRHTPRADGAGS